jgi:hypothetical protein
MTFHDAPLGSYVSEEGWLITEDEAWTLAEWREKSKYNNRYATDEERREARRKTWREYMRRRRARAA